MSEKPTQFIYKLNAMENAAQSANPALHVYSEKRKAVLAYVSRLERALAVAEESLHELLHAVGLCEGQTRRAQELIYQKEQETRAALAQIEELRK